MSISLASFATSAVLAILLCPAYADQSCKPLIQTGPGTLSSQDCYTSGALHTLNASGHFPDVFSSKKYIFPGLPLFVEDSICFLSDGSFSALLGEASVSVYTISIWTNDTKPVIFSLPKLTDNVYTDTLGSSITQLAIIDPTGKYSGKLFSRDVVDLSHHSTGFLIEQNTIVGGTKIFSGAKGTLRLESNKTPSPPATVPVSKLTGIICISEDDGNWARRNQVFNSDTRAILSGG